MTELAAALAKVLATDPFRIVLSVPRSGCTYRRAEAVPRAGGWQIERATDTQVFHQNLVEADLAEALETAMAGEFTQLNSFGESGGYSLRVTKKAKVLTTRTGAAKSTKPASEGHNRQKAALLPEGHVIAPLVDMGVFTKDGRVAAGMYDKYRQIDRFVQLIEDALGDVKGPLSVVDFGCGKSYLTFILYWYLTEKRGIKVSMTGLDLKEDVVKNCNKAAQRYGYDGLRFLVGDIAEYSDERPVDMVVTLHACDTATDYALAAAIGWGARWVFSVPCCQHELNAQLESEEFHILARYGLVKERTAALMTDAIRANLLTACGYKTQLLEFVELSHTPKNILIRARKTGLPAAVRRQAVEEVEKLCTAFALSPCLLRLLRERGMLAE